MNIENKKQVATILLALGLGLVAAFLTSQHVQNNVKQQTQQLAADYAKKSDVQKEETFDEIERMQRDFNRKIAKLAKQQRNMSQNAMKKNNKPVVPLSAFAVRTPPGKRAFTINIDSLSAVGGLINPGDFIDIIARLRVPNEDKKGKSKFNEVTSVLFQNVQVLAVGTNFQPVANKPAYDQQQKAGKLNITMALTLYEASLLSFAQDNGSLQLSLRSPTEIDTNILQIASWETLSDFVLETQGTELPVTLSSFPELMEMRGNIETEVDEVKPFIELFRSGQESNL